MSDTEPFETARLRFEALNESHIQGYLRMWSDPELAKWSPRGVASTIEAARERMKPVITHPSNGFVLNYSMHLLDPPSDAPDAMIGLMGVHRFREGTEGDMVVGEIGYAIERHSWGKGYTTEALHAFLPKFWELRPTIQKISAIVDAENIASQKVLTNSGFVEIQGHGIKGLLMPQLREEIVDPLVFELERPKIVSVKYEQL